MQASRWAQGRRVGFHGRLVRTKVSTPESHQTAPDPRPYAAPYTPCTQEFRRCSGQEGSTTHWLLAHSARHANIKCNHCKARHVRTHIRLVNQGLPLHQQYTAANKPHKSFNAVQMEQTRVILTPVGARGTPSTHDFIVATSLSSLRPQLLIAIKRKL